MFDFFRNRAAADVPQQKASATGKVVAWQSGGRVAWSPRDAVSLT
ncbi:MAG: phage portal protein, partial [Pseudomonadota bacterium]